MSKRFLGVGRHLPRGMLVAAYTVFLAAGAVSAARAPERSGAAGATEGRGHGDELHEVTATIGGHIYTGANDGTGMGGAIFHADDPAATPEILDASVMIEDAEGNFVAYPTVTGNSWSATVAPGEYVVLVAAPDHDATSRRFKVVAGDDVTQEFYLPPLPLPLANLYAYCFEEQLVNGEPDETFMDAPLDGVTLRVYDEDGDLLATGVTGEGFGPDGVTPIEAGGYYFTGLPAGQYVVEADPSTVPFRPSWYHTYSDAGSQKWTIPIYPGDPGIEADAQEADVGGEAAFLIWYGFVEALGQIPNEVVPTVPADASTIHGILWDGDDPVLDQIEGDGEEEEIEPPIPRCVSANTAVPDGKAILCTDDESYTAIATVEADPVTGEFTFVNVPPGRYVVFCQDIPIDYVWTSAQLQVPPNSVVEVGDPFLEFKHLMPRFFARLQGYVYDGTTVPPTPLPGVKVNLRLVSGREYKTTFTGGDGWYNFDDLEEVETIAFFDAEPPQGYRWMSVPGDSATFWPDTCRVSIGLDGQYTIQYYSGLNYDGHLWLEPIAPTEGDIKGFTWYDCLERGTWVGDGVWKKNTEGTLQGVTVNLYDSSGLVLLDTRTSGEFDYQGTIDQGWIPPASQVPPDEFGNMYNGDVLGYYEFSGLAPGDYVVEVVPPAGYSAATPDVIPVTVTGGEWTQADFGMTTLVPRSGKLEGAIWDDLVLDVDPLSIMWMEKAAVVGAAVQVYDHLYYPIDEMVQPSPYPPSTPDIAIHMVPGSHIFYGNDPNNPNFNPDYEPLLLPYSFGQGTAVYEADWSLVPVAFLGLGGAMTGEWPLEALNRPQLAGPGNQKFLSGGDPKPGATVQILGASFGDVQGNGTVTLCGTELPVSDWGDDAITVTLPDKALPGPLLVTTSTGISNALQVGIDYSGDPALETYILARARFVDASNAGPKDGSRANPYPTIQEALDNLPAATPRYVFVAAGVYNERVVIRESDVEILGSGPFETTVSGLGLGAASCQGIVGSGPTFEIETGLENVRISGFTITGGTSDDRNLGGGIFASAHCRNLEISNNRIVRNGGPFGGGFWTHYSTHDVTIHSNVFAENGNFGGFGGGVSFTDHPSEFTPPDIQPEHIWDDYAPGPPPGTIEIYNNQFFHNFSMDYGGGACLYETKDRLLIHGNMFLENKADDHGGALFFEDSGPVDIYNNVFYRNYCPDDGGAISFEDVADTTAHVNIWNNLFAENIADDRGENHARGGALAFDDVRDAMVFNNTITGNIVCGSYHPAGGGLDSERHGHEYSGSGGPLMEPGYSDPKIFNNIIYDNWRLEYEQPIGMGGELEGQGLDYTWGLNYVWSPDEMHVDNPAINSEWEMYLNSESFTVVENNDIRGGYLSGVDNVDVDPEFVGPEIGNWRLTDESPVIDQANALVGPAADLEGYERSVGPNGMIDIGAFEWRPEPGTVMRLPRGILGAVNPPKPPRVPVTPDGSGGGLGGGQTMGQNAAVLEEVRKQRRESRLRVSPTTTAAEGSAPVTVEATSTGGACDLTVDRQRSSGVDMQSRGREKALNR